MPDELTGMGLAVFATGDLRLAGRAAAANLIAVARALAADPIPAPSG